jgi:hypothetical protein
MWRRGFLSEQDYRVAMGQAPPPSFNPFDWLFGGSKPSPEPAPAPDTSWDSTEGESAAPDTTAADSVPP